MAATTLLTETGNAVAEGSGRLRTIDALRGLAAFWVAWFHVTMAGTRLPPNALLGWFSRDGTVGVDVFFVISGFVLPWSLYKSHYRVGRYGRFIAKRIVRIDPPYLLTAFLIIPLNFAVARLPWFTGPPFTVNWASALGHIAFLNAFTGEPWLNVVFWTLAIEFQYYLLIGLIFPFVASPSRLAGACLVAVFLASPFVLKSEAHFPHYACLFLMGIATFQYRAAICGRTWFFAVIALATADAWYVSGPTMAFAGVFATFAIAFLRIDWRPLQWLGAISYSLYLVHAPVGNKVANLVHRLPQTPLVQYFEAIIAMLLSLAAAAVLFRFVEKPARKMASRIPWEPRPRAAE